MNQTESTLIQLPNCLTNWDLLLFLDIFFAPSQTFTTVKTKPIWLLPFILCTITLMVYYSFTNSYRMEDLKEQISSNTSLSSQEIKQRITNIEEQKESRISLVLIGKVLIYTSMNQGVKLFSLAFILWLSLHLYLTKLKFKTILSICSYSFLVIIPEAVLKIPLIILKGSAKLNLGLATSQKYNIKN